MSALPKIVERELLTFFQDRRNRRQVYPLIVATYYERLDQARKILEEDPAQIRDRDPFAGLTALHIAIFRENLPLVRLLAHHPNADLRAADNFGRRPVDMCIYTSIGEIFDLVLSASYPRAMHGPDGPDGQYPGGSHVVSLSRGLRRKIWE